VFLYDTLLGTTTHVSVDGGGVHQGNGDCRVAAISSAGNTVVLESDATNLVACDENGVTDVFVVAP